MRRSRIGFAQWLTVITLVALGLRVAYVLLIRVGHLPLAGDAQYFSHGANLLAQGKGFIDPFTSGAHPAAAHPPLYLLWIAMPSVLTGGHATQLQQMLWSCVLGAGTVAVCGLAGREAAGPRVGLIAAVIAAIYPNIWVHDGMLLSETMALFTTALVILLAFRYWRSPGLARGVLLGAACALAALSRAELALTVPLVLVPVVLLDRETNVRQRLLRLGAAAGVAALVVAPWVTFNFSRFHERVYISTGYGPTFAASNCPETYYGTDLGFKNYECVFRVMRKVSKPGMDASDIDAAARTETMRYVDAHLARVPIVVLARWGRIANLYRPTTDVYFDIVILKRAPSIAWSTLYSFYAVAAAAAAGAVILRRRRIPVYPLLAFPAIVLVSVATTFAQVRYRAPAEAAFVVLAAVAIDALFRLRGRGPTHPDEAEVPDVVPSV